MSYGTTAAQSTLSRYFAIIHLVHVGQSPLPQSLPWTWKFSIPLSLLSSPGLPQFSLIRDFGKQNIRGNVSKISVNHTCYRQIGSKSTNHSPLAWRREGLKVTLVAVIGGFRSDLSITRKTDGNFGNVSVGVCVFQSHLSLTKTVVRACLVSQQQQHATTTIYWYSHI